MRYINRTVTAHAFTLTSSAYAVENTETVEVVQSDVSLGDKIQRRGIAPAKTIKITKTSLYFS